MLFGCLSLFFLWTWMPYTGHSFSMISISTSTQAALPLYATPLAGDVSGDAAAAEAVAPAVVVAMTREAGKNDKLREGILAKRSSSSPSIHFQPVETPCIAHADGKDYPKLQATLQNEPNGWDYVVITSPEAARVLASVWHDCTFADSPPRVAAVGKATETTLRDAGIAVSFCPSKAYAVNLVAELPVPSSSTPSRPPRVLYPASARAQTTLQDGLTERGFEVVRLDTYDTVTAVWTAEERSMARSAHIACFASPSAVKGWLKNWEQADADAAADADAKAPATAVLAACIGETSAQACRANGWVEERIFYAEQPGMDGWVQAVADAAATLPTTTVAAVVTANVVPDAMAAAQQPTP